MKSGNEIIQFEFQRKTCFIYILINIMDLSTVNWKNLRSSYNFIIRLNWYSIVRMLMTQCISRQNRLQQVVTSHLLYWNLISVFCTNGLSLVGFMGLQLCLCCTYIKSWETMLTEHFWETWKGDWKILYINFMQFYIIM